mgnify:CR=1 FL=1
MVEYECKRCGYITNRKGNMKYHLNRKNPCKATLEDISIENLKKIYDFDRNDINILTPALILRKKQIHFPFLSSYIQLVINIIHLEEQAYDY